MQRSFLLLILTLAFTPLCIQAQTTNVPDAAFEDYLETHTADGVTVNVGDADSMGDGTANNGLVLNSRIENVVSLNVSGLGINDLSGIAGFTSLETLVCSDNQLQLLDISANTNLKSLLCGSNQLTNLDLSTIADLEILNCSNNQLIDLDVSNNTVLESLTASGNQLSQINTNNNTALTLLNIANNRISGELIVNNNLDLESLICASNQISILNLSQNTSLKNLRVSDNLFTALDLSTINTKACPDPQTDPLTICQDTASIDVSRNNLSSLILANGFNDLISDFNSEDNPDLFCIQIDNAFTPPSGWTKDDWTYYGAAACADIYTYVPDDSFEQALIDQNYDDVLDNLVLTANIRDLINLDVSNRSISSLIGIEDFEDLETLNCSNNDLSNIDLSQNMALTDINCTANTLTSIELASNINLIALDCSNNDLSTIDITANTGLTSLNCANNQLIQLDISSNNLLTDLDCSFNAVEVLNTVQNTALTTLSCNNNALKTLNVKNGNNGVLATLNALNNPDLFCIEVDDVANANAAGGWQKDTVAGYNLGCGTYIPDVNFEQALIDQGIDSDNTLNNFVPTADVRNLLTLDVSGLSIADLTGIQDFQDLQDLNCASNALSILDLNSNLQLQNLNCSGNQIEDLSLVPNTNLVSIDCSANSLFTLDIKNTNNALLTTFNATNNPNLFCINVDDAIIGNIPVGWQKDAIANYNSDCKNNRFTAIPDANFEQALIDLGLDTGPLDNQVLTSNIEHVTSLSVNDKQIESLEGIKDFALLQSLDCSNNFLNTLDVSNMQNLEELFCSSNYFLTNNSANVNGLLNIDDAINLRKLFCASNNLADLNVSALPNLEALDCADNALNTLDITGNIALQVLNCSNNNLVNLDISTNLVLEDVNCDSNNISNLITATANNTTLTNLSCANNDLSDIQIGNYIGILSLKANTNQLSRLNTGTNLNLEFLETSRNEITNLDVSTNVNLVQLYVSQNQLTQLDLASNTLLQNVDCDFNEITQLDINSLTDLRYLTCANNELTEIDASANIDLIELDVSSNSISNLVLPNDITQLKRFNCSNNQLSGGFDLSTMGTGTCPPDHQNSQEICTNEIVINVSNNQLDFLNIQNGLNSRMIRFNASANVDLTCIQVDDVNNIGVNWIKDATAEYSTDCRFGETYVPDDNFEQALITLGYDTLPLDDYVPTANIVGLLNIDLSNNAITDLTGIEDFEAIQLLNISDNSISTLDLSKNENLTQLDVSNNDISDLDVSKNTALTHLNCAGNTLSDLDLSANMGITNLDISNNNFSLFTPSDVPTLQVFACDGNNIVDLDFSSNTTLTSLSSANNLLEVLNLQNGENANLLNLNVQNNPSLSCIQTDDGTVPGGVTWLKDATTVYAIDCHFGETYVPDDNFEQALIDLGYDIAPLDDYVPTANIERVSFLSVKELDIADLTGIEGFTELSNFNFQDNVVTTVDLSANGLLTNLNASGNQLTTINLSNQPNLRIADVSNNMLTQINTNFNLELIELNVSGNLITVLDVSLLLSLERLNCSFNQLTALNVTLNDKLTELLCASNAFIQDRLNLQNGANTILRTFNATDNPDLGCILVDDPVAVISNVDGTYDNWFKDTTASYQIICDDADNDGVANADDVCPGTPFGASVDLFGCPYSVLPEDNFTILITGETCLNNNDGKINIVTKELYEYKANLVGEDFNRDYIFTNEIDILNLLAGTYTLCITSDELPNFQRCFDVVINHPENLEVITGKSKNGKAVTFNLSGSSNYNIDFNGLRFSTSESSITLQLEHGKNTVKISTDLPCQGVHEERVLLSENMLVYPNPFDSELHLYLGEVSDDETIKLSIYTYLGEIVLNKEFKKLDSRNLNIVTDCFTSGIYTVVVSKKDSLSTFKIVKK